MGTKPRKGMVSVPARLDPQRFVDHCPFTGKVSYTSELAAKAMVDHLNTGGSVYVCECGSWHLTRSD